MKLFDHKRRCTVPPIRFCLNSPIRIMSRREASASSPESLVVRGASWASFRRRGWRLPRLRDGARRGYRYIWIWVGGVGGRRMDGRRCKEKDLVVFYVFCCCGGWMDGFVQSWMVGVGRRQLRLTLDSQTYPVLSKIIYSYYVVKSLCREQVKRSFLLSWEVVIWSLKTGAAGVCLGWLVRSCM